MSFSQLIQKRYSVRNYTTQQVEEEKLNAILEAGRLAPTAANLQPVKVIVVKSCEAMTKIKKAANIYNAPLALIVCADHKTAWTRPFDEKQTTDIDATIITDHMMIQATELGLGSVWICYFKPDVLKTEFNLPNNLEPINILAIGYADENDEPTFKQRNSIEEFTQYNY